MSGPTDALRTPRGAPGGHGETYEGEDGSHTRSPLGTLPPDAILLASTGGTVPVATAAKVSTPVPPGAKRNGNGSYSLRIGMIDLTILPDTTTAAAKMKNRAKTRLQTAWTTPGYQFSGGKITTHDQPTVSATIQTTYGPGAKPSDRSGYGKGKTLKDHEGHHGTDFIDYMKANQPTFTGKNGMTVAEFKKTVKDFEDYMKAYDKKAAEKSERETDCTGVKASFCK